MDRRGDGGTGGRGEPAAISGSSGAPSIYGPRATFRTRARAEQFMRHLTRELTAGGLAHWCELREPAPGRWVPVVHYEACAGGAACQCAETASSTCS